MSENSPAINMINVIETIRNCANRDIGEIKSQLDSLQIKGGEDED
jgi:hypothetical protein